MIGHRGACGYRPEHTASAYELAFALGAQAVEPDVVLSRDGVPVVRHENEISGTTDVASRPEFAGRRRTASVDGEAVTGWFTEDFTWAELSTLRARERLGALRPGSASFDGRFGLLRLADVLRIAEEAGGGVVVEVKHATHFEALGLPMAEIVAAELREAGWGAPGAATSAGWPTLVMESFEQTVLTQLRAGGLDAGFVYLLEATGAAFDLVARHGKAAPGYSAQLEPAALRALAAAVDGVSVDKNALLADPSLVGRAHAAGLDVFTWTLRPENRFLTGPYRRGMRKGEHGDWAGEFAAVYATGVDGVFADHPDLALEARGSVGGAA